MLDFAESALSNFLLYTLLIYTLPFYVCYYTLDVLRSQGNDRNRVKTSID